MSMEYGLTFQGKGFNKDLIEQAVTELWDRKGQDLFHKSWETETKYWVEVSAGENKDDAFDYMAFAIVKEKSDEYYWMYKPMGTSGIEGLFYDIGDYINGHRVGISWEIIKLQRDNKWAEAEVLERELYGDREVYGD